MPNREMFETLHEKGAQRYGALWLTANRQAIELAMGYGLDYEKHRTALSHIVKWVLDTAMGSSTRDAADNALAGLRELSHSDLENGVHVQIADALSNEIRALSIKEKWHNQLVEWLRTFHAKIHQEYINQLMTIHQSLEVDENQEIADLERDRDSLVELVIGLEMVINDDFTDRANEAYRALTVGAQAAYDIKKEKS